MVGGVRVFWPHFRGCPNFRFILLRPGARANILHWRVSAFSGKNAFSIGPVRSLTPLEHRSAAGEKNHAYTRSQSIRGCRSIRFSVNQSIFICHWPHRRAIQISDFYVAVQAKSRKAVKVFRSSFAAYRIRSQIQQSNFGFHFDKRRHMSTKSLAKHFNV